MWFIRFSVLCVHEYCHHVYSLTITNQSLFSFYSHLNIFFLLQIQFHASDSYQHLLANKNQNKKFQVLLRKPCFLPLLTWLNFCTWLNFFSNFIRSYKRYNICLISFFSLHELFLAFIRANNIGSLVNSLLRVKIFNLFFLIFLHHLLMVTCQINLQILLYSRFFIFNPQIIFTFF